MSSPTTNTPGSRSISSCSASFSASDIVSSRCAPVAGSHYESLPGVSQSAGAYTSSSAASGSGRGEASANSTASSTSRSCLLLDLLEPREIDAVLLGEVAREAQDRVACAPGVELLDGPEVGLRRRGVGCDAVALRLDQGRAVAGARPSDRLAR